MVGDLFSVDSIAGLEVDAKARLKNFRLEIMAASLGVVQSISLVHRNESRPAQAMTL